MTERAVQRPPQSGREPTTRLIENRRQARSEILAPQVNPSGWRWRLSLGQREALLLLKLKILLRLLLLKLEGLLLLEAIKPARPS